MTAQKDNGCKTFQRCAEDVTRTFNNGAAKTSRCRRASCNGSWIDFTSENEDSILALTSYISKSTFHDSGMPNDKGDQYHCLVKRFIFFGKTYRDKAGLSHPHDARLFDQQAYLWRVANERAAVTRFGAGATLAQTPTSVLPRRLGEPLGKPDWILGLSDNRGSIGRGFVRTRRQFPPNLCPNNTSFAAPIRGHATELHTSHSLVTLVRHETREAAVAAAGGSAVARRAMQCPSVRPRPYHRIVFVSDRTDGPADGRSFSLTNRPLIFAPTFQLLHF